jgi:hypothetical protein
MLLKKFRIKFNFILKKIQEKKEDKVVHTVLENSQPPIYHIHIRKTAGTSINFSFFF